MQKEIKSNSINEVNQTPFLLGESKPLILKGKPIDKRQKSKSFKLISYINPFAKTGKWIAEIIKQKKHKQKIFMILMQNRNGKYSQFTIATAAQTFTYHKGTYYIDPDMVRENVFAKMNMLFYHQDCCIPFKIDFNIGELRSKLQESNSDVEKAINPITLKSFINAQVIEKVLKGAEMSNELKMIKMIVIINTIAIVGLGLMIAKMGGMI